MTEGISVVRVLSKRRIISADSSMEAHKSQAKVMAVAKELGRDIRIFATSATPSDKSLCTYNSESADFYDFTAEDYRRILKHKKEDKYLKTRKIREVEEAARRSK